MNLRKIFIFIVLFSYNAVASEVSKQEFEFTADRLETQELNANLVIKNHSSSDIKIILKGDKSLIEKVMLSNEEGNLLIEQLHDYETNEKKFLEVEILKPHNLPIKIGMMAGTLNMPENNHCDLNLLFIGSVNANINKIEGDVDISVAGNSKIKIKEAKGNADIEVNGEVDVDVQSGNFDYLLISSTGNNNLNIAATVYDGEFSMIGSGKIEVKNLTGSINRMELIGTGNINLFTHKK